MLFTDTWQQTNKPLLSWTQTNKQRHPFREDKQANILSVKGKQTSTYIKTQTDEQTITHTHKQARTKHKHYTTPSPSNPAHPLPIAPHHPTSPAPTQKRWLGDKHKDTELKHGATKVQTGGKLRQYTHTRERESTCVPLCPRSARGKGRH